jgi:transcriptional regulator with XRE-family HTH domain
MVIVMVRWTSMTDKQRHALLKRFGQRVRDVRASKGFSQEALALACDLDRTYIGGVERGERNISLVNIYRLSKALEIPASDLL